MRDFIKSITEDELRFISRLNYGLEEERHYESLKQIIYKQDCVGNYDQSWYPYEVIELGSHWLQKGHEREFTICTLLVIINVIEGNDGGTDLSYKFDSRAEDYENLPSELKELLISSYESANI